jgi:hypothetical protein
MKRRTFFAMLLAAFVPQKQKPTAGAVAMQAQDAAVRVQSMSGITFSAGRLQHISAREFERLMREWRQS